MAKAKEKLDWKEYPDPTPVEIPVEMTRPETMDEKIRRIINTQISVNAGAAGTETIDEANDFDVKDDFEVEEPVSVHEVFDMEPEYPEDLQETKKAAQVKPDESEENPSSADDSEPPRGGESSSTEPENTLEQEKE